jgi:hypothetical protein|tara:strand:- start:213 stop:563 length:351 start_codon:yes stop_codon:yes gene_type:complete
MRVILNKTIEEMAKIGYEPVLGPMIYFSLRPLPTDDQAEIDLDTSELRETYRQQHPESHLVNRIAAFGIKTKQKTRRLAEPDPGPLSVIVRDTKVYPYIVLPFIEMDLMLPHEEES